MGSRLELQDSLETLMGNKNVYYNPPSNLAMSYPAIKYEINTVYTLHADNKLYSSTICYNLTIIGKVPNDAIVTKLLSLPMCSFDRHYTYDGLSHDVLKLYY